MKKKNYSITPLWDSYAMDNKTKESRVRLTINLNNSRIRVTLKVRCTKDEFDAAMNSRSTKAKELKMIINDYISKAETILERLLEPSKESFLRLFKSETDLFKSNKTDVFYFYQLKYDEMIKAGRIGTAKYYKGCKRSLKEFKSILYFEDIDERFLRDYQSYLLEKGNSISTASLRLRGLRIMFNVAIKQGFVSEKHYPFKRFSLPSATKSKKVLYPPQLKLLFNYEPKTLREERAKDYFFFCFLSNGMNFKDMVNLKWKDINGNTISFVRQKTKNTTSEINEITVHLHDEAKRIIEKWANIDRSATAYVFPILPKKFKSIEHLEEIRNRKEK